MANQDELYAEVAAAYGAALERLARAYLTDPDRVRDLERLQALVRCLKPLDRQLMLLYLEGVDAASIGEVTGLSAGNVATKIHRIKAVLARRFHDTEAR